MSGWMTAAGEIISVALAEHTGPWTADDAGALPDAGDHARFEVYDGGVLVASPAPGAGHRRASYRLHRALAQAATHRTRRC
jgi:Uma2 family endonuclease